MGILNYLIIILLLIFPIGELGRFQFNSVSITINDMVLLFVFLAWIFKIKRVPDLRGYLRKPISIFVIIGFVSLILNLYWLRLDYFFVSLLYLVRFVLYSSLYFILVKEDKEFIAKLKNIILIPISFVILGGYIQFFFYQSLRNLWYLGWDEHLYRLFAGFLDPNFAGAVLVMTFMYLIYMTWQSYLKNNLKFSLLVFLSALNFVAVYLTYSRSALIMLVISLIVFLVFVGRKRFIIGFIILSVIVVVLAPKSFKTEGTNLFRMESSIQRVQSAQAALKIIQTKPIFGVGFNAYRYAMNKYGIAIDDIWQTTHSGAGTDNSFLFVLATTGFIGLISYLYLLFKLFYLAKLKIKENKFAIVLVSVLCGLIFNSLFVNSLFFVYILELVWIFAAFTENS